MEQATVGQFFKAFTHQYPAPYRYYLVLDASRDDGLYPQLMDDGQQAGCLFKGDLSESLQAIAPYLVEYRGDSAYFMDWLAAICQHPWGLLLVTQADVHTVYKHLRHLIYIRHYQGMMVQFRFHDSFYLARWLASADINQQHKLFGPISVMWGKGDDENTLYQWHLDPQAQTKTQTVALNGALPTVQCLGLSDRRRHTRSQVLTMEREQLEQMETAILKQQCQQVQDFLQQHHGKLLKNKPDPLIQGQILRVIQRGRHYGFYDVMSLAWLASTSFKVSAYFDTQPTINRLLRHKQDIDWLLKHSQAKDWQEAKTLTLPYGSHKPAGSKS